MLILHDADVCISGVLPAARHRARLACRWASHARAAVAAGIVSDKDDIVLLKNGTVLFYGGC